MSLRAPARFWKWTTAVVLFHFVSALVLASCPELHEKLHHHHDEAQEHECAVTILTNGLCEAGFAPLQAAPPELHSYLPLRFSQVAAPEALALEGQSLGRAPPLAV